MNCHVKVKHVRLANVLLKRVRQQHVIRNMLLLYIYINLTMPHVEILEALPGMNMVT
jgi:hypothetical protein